MKKKLLYTIVLCLFMFVLTACSVEEEKKGQEPIEDVNSLLDKYADGDEEESSEAPSETESIDYDKIDQDIINQIVANGGKVSSGDEIANDPSTNANLVEMGPVYYSTEGFTLDSEDANGIRTYRGNSLLDAVSIKAYTDNTSYYSAENMLLLLESLMIDIYGNYRQKSIYVNDYGIEFNWYRYDSVNSNGVYVMCDMFYYSNGYDTIMVECATNASLNATTERIYSFVDSIRFK